MTERCPNCKAVAEEIRRIIERMEAHIEAGDVTEALEYESLQSQIAFGEYLLGRLEADENQR